MEEKIIAKLSAVSILGNAALSAIKLLAGIFGHSGAMVSDAIHSMSDVFTTVIAWLGVHLSMKEADKEHPYGHERLECVASLFLGTLLGVTGLGIGYSGVTKIVSGDYAHLAVPTWLALAAAIISIIAKEGMYWYTRHYAKILNSAAFMADAWHHRSDALSSIGSLVGIGGAMLGYPVFDPIASVVICAFILKVAWDILLDSVRKMLDTSCDEAFQQEVRNLILAQDRVDSLDDLKTRMFGNKIYIDAEIGLDGNMTLNEAHDIAESVHDEVERHYPDIKHIMIHVNPSAAADTN